MAETVFIYFVLFVLGASIGSFLNVLIDRIPRRETITSGRSRCESCKKTLSWYELIPLLSFLFLGGKCNACKKAIPLRLFLVELLSGISFCLLYYYISLQFLPLYVFLFLVMIFSILLCIFFIDLQYGIIPDALLLILLAATVLLLFTTEQSRFIGHFASGVVFFLIFLSLFLFTRGKGMGFGDVKFSFIIGLLLGFPGIIVAFYTAFLTGAVVSLFLVASGKKKFQKDTIPFGPFLSIAALFSYFFTDIIVSRIITLF